MSEILQVHHNELGLTLPYSNDRSLPTTFPDVHNRDIYSLVSSISRYGYRLQSKQAVIPEPDLDKIIPTITRFCDNTTTQDDYRILIDTYPPSPMKSRIVFHSTILRNNASELFGTLSDIRTYEQVLFVHGDDTSAFTIFLLFPAQAKLELYFIGDTDMIQVEDLVRRINGCFSLLMPNSSLNTRCRLQIPLTFDVDRGVMAYILVLCLHGRYNYLELNAKTIAIQKLQVLMEFIEHHDNWFGRVNVADMTKLSHPFFKGVNPATDNPEEVNALGWTIVDVQGDGNCGFYSLILGLENNNIFDFSFIQPINRFIPMRRNKPWQYNVMKLRHRLQKKSQNLVRAFFGDEYREYPWNLTAGIGTKEDIPALSDEFYTSELTQDQYFDGTLVNNIDFHDFQMSAFWAPMVFSCLFQIRVIVYMRFSKWNGVKASTDWSTGTMDHSADIARRIILVDGLHKISDAEFKRMPTVEILYSTGETDCGVKVDNHFRFLRRVLCDDINPVIDETPPCLRDFVQRGMDGQRNHTDHNLQGTLPPERESPEHIDNHQEESMAADIDAPILPDSHDEVSLFSDKVSTESPTINPQLERQLPTVKKMTKYEKKRQFTRFFNKHFEKKTLKHKTPTRMLYKSITNEFYVWQNDDTANHPTRSLCRNIDDYDITLINAAKELPDEWVGPRIGDSRESVAPQCLNTKIVCLHQQHENGYCLTFSLASALFYCGFRLASEGLAGQAERISQMHFEGAILEIRRIMEEIVPIVGRPTVYGRRTKTSKRTTRHMTWEDLLLSVTPFPTVVIPISTSIQATHSFCVVDDLIFDSTTPRALKLCFESVKWIFHGEEPDIYQVLRFNMKVSPKGKPIWEQYKRQVVFHWDHPARNNNT